VPLETPASSQLAAFAQRFWSWRRGQQPRSSDDIPRLDRPAGWLPDWSADAVARYRSTAAAFADEWAALLPDPHEAVAQAITLDDRALIVDHALLGSAIERVHFELDVMRAWQTHPGFYIDASLGVVFDLLLSPDAFDESRTREIITALGHTPRVIGWAEQNLAGHARTELVQIAVASLAGIEDVVERSMTALSSRVPTALRVELHRAADIAARSLSGFRAHLTDPGFRTDPWQPLGEEALAHFLRTIALNPLSVDRMLAIGDIELQRSEALTAIEAAVASADGAPAAPLLASIAAQIEQERLDEAAVREFYEARGILSQPETLGHYLVDALPAYLAPLRWLGVTDELTSDARVDRDAVSYMPDPRPGLPFFYDANARDPRAGIIHEGAHYQQLALSWRHPDEIRRRYYDSGPNEGIAFYNEELMLRSGLFDDAPGTRAAVHAFLRLRALRVLVDLGLVTGRMSIPEAGRYMAERVPMDAETADHEAAYFAATPAQAMTYQIGKTQIQAFLADAARVQGERFSLRDFHDYLWLNGNVPIALQRYELLGLTDELDAIRL
jgi:hypothetical protein